LDFAEEDEKDDDDKETNVRPLADEKYYERHFSVILNTALRLYRRLFDATELALLGGFERMGMDTRRLLIRLSQRQARWFRVPQLRYSEISSIPEAVAELQAAGWCIGGTWHCFPGILIQKINKNKLSRGSAHRN